MLICLILWYGWRAMQIIIIMYNNDSLGWLDKDWKHWLTMYIHRHNTNIHLFINNTTRSVQCRWCMRYVIDSDSVHDIRDGDTPFWLWLKSCDIRCSDWRRETQATLSGQDAALGAENSHFWMNKLNSEMTYKNMLQGSELVTSWPLITKDLPITCLGGHI